MIVRTPKRLAAFMFFPRGLFIASFEYTPRQPNARFEPMAVPKARWLPQPVVLCRKVR